MRLLSRGIISAVGILCVSANSLISRSSEATIDAFGKPYNASVTCDEGVLPLNGFPDLPVDSTYALCVAYPSGLGLKCEKNQIFISMPPGSLFNGDVPPLELYEQCLILCSCEDDPPIQEEAQGEQDNAVKKESVTEDDNYQEDEDMDAQSQTASDHSTEVHANDDLDLMQFDFKNFCVTSGLWATCPASSSSGDTMSSKVRCTRGYGGTVAGDCSKVISLARSYRNEAANLPITFASDNCLLTVTANDTSTSTEMTIPWRDVAQVAEHISRNCTRAHRIGGYSHTTSKSKNAAVDVHLYGPRSRFAKHFNATHNCTANPTSADCSFIRSLPRSSPSSSAPTSPHLPPSFAAARPQQCGSRCYSHSDCDIASDCVCAAGKDADWGLSPTWGTFACRHIVNALAAITVATVQGQCRGRCLLQSDGSLAPTEDIGATIVAGNTSYTINVPAPGASAGPGPAGKVYTGANDTALIAQGRFKDLVCPCNCTYISQACCLGPVVYEDAKNNVLQSDKWIAGVAGENGNSGIRCDRNSSQAWLRQTQGQTQGQANEGIVMLSGGKPVPWKPKATPLVP